LSAELTPAAVVLLALLAALLLHDYTTNKRRAHHLWLQAFVFVVGGGLIIYPEIARRLARVVGIGRGVDFVLYPLVIWLVRESLLSRRRRHEDEEKITELVRALAILQAQKVDSPERASPPAQ
jgi:hypothetical protein